jgi:hypothetical protein
MPNIERPTIDTDVVRVALSFYDLLRLVMTSYAKRLQFAEHESVPVAAMGNDMVDGPGRCDRPTLEAFLAKRLLPQLYAAASLPKPGLIECLRLQALGWSARLGAGWVHVSSQADTQTGTMGRSSSRIASAYTQISY